MANERQDRAASELSATADAFIAALRLAQGMDMEIFSRLRASIIEVGDAWAEDDYLPKIVVNILVGLFSWIDSASYLYSGDEASTIRQAAMEIETLVFQHVVPAPEG